MHEATGVQPALRGSRHLLAGERNAPAAVYAWAAVFNPRVTNRRRGGTRLFDRATARCDTATARWVPRRVDAVGEALEPRDLPRLRRP